MSKLTKIFIAIALTTVAYSQSLPVNEWNLATYNGAQATYSNGLITVTNPGSDYWNIQLTHAGISLQQGHKYQASATLTGTGNSQNRTFDLRIGRNGSPYDAFGEFGGITVYSTPHAWTAQFTMNQATTTDARFEVNAGFNMGNVQIGNVSVTCLDCNASSSSSVPSSSSSSIDTTLPSTPDSAVAFTDLSFSVLAAQLQRQTVVLTQVNQGDSVWLGLGATVTMKGFPTDWVPNTLVLQFNPEVGEQLNCIVEMDNRLFSITGPYAEIHVPFHGELTDVATVRSCVSGSAKVASVAYWVDNSGSVTTPIGQIQPDATNLGAGGWQWVNAGDTVSYEIHVKAGMHPRLEFQGNGNVGNVQAFINGTPLGIPVLPYAMQSDLLIAGDYRIDLVAGSDATLGFRWVNAPATWDSVSVATTDGTGLGGKLVRTYDFSSVPGVSGSFGMTYSPETFVGNVAPVVTASPRPDTNGYIQSGMSAWGPEYHVVASIATDSVVTFAFPVPMDSSQGKVQGLLVHLETDDNLTSTWHSVDSVRNGMAYFRTAHFSHGGLVAYGGASGFFAPMVASALQPATQALAATAPANPSPSSPGYNFLLSGLTFVAGSGQPTRIDRLQLGPQIVTSRDNLEILLADRIQHKLDPTKPLRWGTVVKKFPMTFSLKGLRFSPSGYEFLPVDPTKDSVLQFQPSFSLSTVMHALVSYNSCDNTYLAPLCIGDLVDLRDSKTQLTEPSRDDYLLSSLDVFTSLQMLAWVDPTLDPKVLSAMNTMEDEIRKTLALTSNVLGRNNIPMRGQAALTLASLRRAPMTKVLSTNWMQNLKNSTLDALFYDDLNELQTSYISNLYDSTSGAFTEGVGYLTYINQVMYPLFALGIKSGKLTVADVPEPVKKSGYWLLNMLWETGSAPEVSDGISGAKIWVAPYTVLTGDPIFQQYSEMILPATPVKPATTLKFRLNEMLEAPSHYAMRMQDFLTWPSDTFATGNTYVPKRVLGGVGTLAYTRPDNQVVSLRMTGKTEFQRIHGASHDQQDNSNITLTWFDGENAYDLIVDPGYPGYSMRDASAFFQHHNTFQYAVDSNGGVSINQPFTFDEAKAMMPKELLNALSDADAEETTALAIALSTMPTTTATVIACLTPWVNCNVNNTNKAIDSVAIRLYHSGGGPIVNGRMDTVASPDTAIRGLTETLIYDKYKGLVRDKRTVLMWDNQYFVIDRPWHIILPTYGYDFKLHWNFPYQDNLASATSSVGDSLFFQYGNQGVQASFFSTVVKNGQNPTLSMVEYPASPGEYIPSCVDSITNNFPKDTCTYLKSKYAAVFQQNIDSLSNVRRMAWGTDILFHLHQFDLTEPMTNTDIMISAFQPRMVSESLEKWIQWNCGPNALCLEKRINMPAQYLVVKRTHGQALTVTLPDGCSTPVIINQDIVGITEAPGNVSCVPTITTHEVSP